MDKNALIQYLIQQELNKKNANQEKINGFQEYKNSLNKVQKWGDTAQKTGNFLKDNVNNEFAKKFGSKIANVGENLSNGASSVSDILNTPSNYFKGQANRTIGNGLSNISSSLANNQGVIGKIGQTLGNSLGSSVAGTTSGIGSSAIGNAIGAETAGTASSLGTSALGSSLAEATGGSTAAIGTGANSALTEAIGSATAGGSAAGGTQALASAGPWGAIIAGIIAAVTAKRKLAKMVKETGQRVLDTTNEISKTRVANNLALAKRNSDAQLKEAQQNLETDTITGGAAPIQNENPITDYQNYLRNEGYDENVINGIPQGLNNGYREIADWINQYNTGAGRDNPIRLPQTDEEIAAAQAGTFNTPVQTGNVETQENIKRGLLDKFISGLTDLSKGYDENRNTAYNPNNLAQKKFADNTDKSKMGRLGEALGTASRTLNRPGVQGLIAGGLSTALTGNPLYGLGLGYKLANQKAMSDIYTKALKENGIDVDTGLFGNMDSSGMDALMKPQYKEAVNNLALEKLKENQNYHELLMKYYRDKLGVDKDYKDKKLKIDKQNADARTYAAHNGGSRSTKPQEQEGWNDDLNAVLQAMNNPKKYNVKKVREEFIRIHGYDPLKYLQVTDNQVDSIIEDLLE